MVTNNSWNSQDPAQVAKGGTGAATLTGVLTGNGTSAVTANAVTQYGTVVAGASNAVTSVAPSATSGVPLVSQGASSNPAYSTAVVAGGGTGVTSTTAYAVLCGGTTSTGALQSIAGVGSSGQVLTSNGAGALPTFQDAAGGLSWTDVTGTSQSAAVGNGYIANNASLVTITLPATFAVGDIVHVVGLGAGLWKLAANTGDTIHFGSEDTSAGGDITATNRYDAIQVIGVVANSEWACTGIAQGNLTVA